MKLVTNEMRTADLLMFHIDLMLNDFYIFISE